MLKQWTHKGLNVSYVFIKDENTILTSDGILLDYDYFKGISSKAYETLKVSKALYNYTKSKETGKLTFKTVVDLPLGDILVEPKKEIPVEKAKPVVEHKEKTIKKSSPKKKKKVDFTKIIVNAERFIMLLISIFTIILSIYYTRSYLLKTNPNLIATFLSISMLLFSLIGVQLIKVFWKKKNYLVSVILALTSATTLLFSMFTSLDVNMTKYIESAKVIELENQQTSTRALVLQSVQNQMTENRKQVDILVTDMEYYASRNLNTFTQREEIARLNTEYAELSNRETEILLGDSSISIHINEQESNASSLVEIIARVLGIKAETLQMIIMSFASVFIDILSPLALYIFIYGKNN